MSSVGVRLVCFGLLLLVGISLASVKGNDLTIDHGVNTPSQPFEVRSRLHHLRSSSSSVLDARQDGSDAQALVDIGTSAGVTNNNEELDKFDEVEELFTEEDEEAFNILQQHPVLTTLNPFTPEVRTAMKHNIEQSILQHNAMLQQFKQASSQRIAEQFQQLKMSSKSNSKLKLKPKVATKPLPISRPKGKPQQKNSSQMRKPIAKPDRSLPISGSIKKKAIAKQSPSFLQLNAQLQAQVEAESEAESTMAVGLYPLFSLGDPSPFGPQTIQLLRTGIQANPSPTEYRGEFFRLCRGSRGCWSVRLELFATNQQYHHHVRHNNWRSNFVTYSSILLARSLVDEMPLVGEELGNRVILLVGPLVVQVFMPLISIPNIVRRIIKVAVTEMIAFHVAAQCANLGHPGTVSVNIEFNQWDAVNHIYPTAGTYNILVDHACVNALTLAAGGGGGGGCVGGGVAFGVGNAYVRTFCRWSHPLVLAGGGPQFDLHYFTQFENGPGDAIALHPLTRQQFFP